MKDHYSRRKYKRVDGLTNYHSCSVSDGKGKEPTGERILESKMIVIFEDCTFIEFRKEGLKINFYSEGIKRTITLCK